MYTLKTICSKVHYQLLNSKMILTSRPLIVCVFLYTWIPIILALLRCKQVQNRPKAEYQLIRSNRVSSMSVIASSNFLTLKRCVHFAVEQGGLGINFVQPRNVKDNSEDTCLVYDCPDFDTSLMKNGSQYGYYSPYTRNLKLESNLTCLPGVGMFILHLTRLNFSSAKKACEMQGAHLALITSDERTNGLSKLVATLGLSSRLHRAYVGLTDIDQEGKFTSVLGEPLDCFQFRGWAPGEPRGKRQNEDCVVLDSRQSWRVVNCQTKLPFICELLPNVSSIEYNNVTNSTGNSTSNNTSDGWNGVIYFKFLQILFY